jgi:cystathionine beta-lyase family protein involved in aluminum resistance
LNNSLASFLEDKFQISRSLLTVLAEAESECLPIFKQLDERSEYNQLKLIKIFQDKQITDYHLNGSTGYGYGDVGRDALEQIFAALFGGETALVRTQIVSGTHALALGILGNLKSGQELISAVGTPYDTMQKVIGLHQEPGSLLDIGGSYQEIALTPEGNIDTAALLQSITDKTGMVLFQRSRGYQWRRSIGCTELADVIKQIKDRFPQVICFVDNCYCEMIEITEPGEIGADLVAGSLIKNPGGSLTRCGGYLVGKSKYIAGAARRLTAPGLGKDVGASLDFNRVAYQGLFQAPLITGQAVKGAVLAAAFFKRLGYQVLPEAEAPRYDIVQAICLNSPEKLIAFCQGIQKASPLDAMFTPEPANLPGYDYPVIMAGGTFVQGSSIELSSDGPIRPPYIAYLQGGIALSQIKLGLLLAAKEVSALDN